MLLAELPHCASMFLIHKVDLYSSELTGCREGQKLWQHIFIFIFSAKRKTDTKNDVLKSPRWNHLVQSIKGIKSLVMCELTRWPATPAEFSPLHEWQFVSVYKHVLTLLKCSCPPTAAGPECSRNFTAPRGVIKTPGFPDKYPNNLDCTFMIFAPKMSEIVVEFDSFDMEPDTTPPPGAICRYDWLEIWDGFPAGEGRWERDNCLIGDEKISPQAGNKGKCFLLKGLFFGYLVIVNFPRIFLKIHEGNLTRLLHYAV